MKTIKNITIGLTLCLASASTFAHNGHGDELPWQACSEAKKNDSCEFTNSHNDLFRGNCKVFSGALMCVRNKPIIHLGEVITKPAGDVKTAKTETTIPVTQN